MVLWRVINLLIFLFLLKKSNLSGVLFEFFDNTFALTPMQIKWNENNNKNIENELLDFILPFRFITKR